MDNMSDVADFRRQIWDELAADEIRAKCDERDLARLDEEDDYALCFIHWKKGDVDAAVKFALEVLSWRKEQNIFDVSADEFGMEMMQAGIICCHGKAVDDTRLVYFMVRKQTKDMKSKVQRLICLWLERIQRAEPGKHITFVLDVSKSSLANVDLGGIRFLLACFTTYFPDMLEKILILEMPWIMNTIWKVVKQWMTEEQRKRTLFCSFKDVKQYIDEENCLKYMGGKDDWEYTYPPYPDENPAITAKLETNGISDSERGSISDEYEEEEEIVVEDIEITQCSVIPTSANDRGDEEVGPSPSIPIVTTNESMRSLRGGEPHARVRSSTPKDSPVKNGLNSMMSDQNKEEDTTITNSKSAIAPEVKIKSTYKDNKVLPTPNLDETIREQPPSDDVINLETLLTMSPMSEVVFNHSSKDANTSRYRADLTLTNRHDVEGMAVAFKVKTNSPERYHVKPSTGSIGRGEVLIIRIHLSPGYEELVSRDRFLILYQKMQAGSDVAQFWKNHNDKSDRFEHRIRVRFNAAEKKHESPIILTNSVEAPKVLKTPSKPTIPSEELAGLHRELGRVKGQLSRVEEQVDWIRSYFVYSLLLQSFLLILLFFVIHKLTSITYILESTESDPNGRFSEVVNSADRTSL